ncbi:unnamed protein product [Alopecurus aequalis]
MTGSSGSNGGGKAIAEASVKAPGGSTGGADLASSSEAEAAGSEVHVSEMMGRLRLTAAEAAAVVLDEGVEDVVVHSQWALVGKVLAPNKLHISTIAAALRPAWGNPRGLYLNPAGDNLFVAEFGTKADKTRVLDGPPWVVGKHAVLLREFNADLRPKDMIFNAMKIWARIINLPFGYMHKKCGAMIAGSLGIEGSTPVVDCDNTGRCWGSFMRVRVEVDVDKPLMRGVTVFSQRRNATEWFDVQYEHIPHYCFSCGIVGHSSIECKNPGERDSEGKLPYSADRLLAPDERKKKNQGARSSSDSISAEQGRASTQFSSEVPNQAAAAKSGAGRNQKKGEDPEVSSPVKQKQQHARATNARAAKGQGKVKDPSATGGSTKVGQKRKSQPVYRAKEPAALVEEQETALALVVHQGVASKNSLEALSEGDQSSDSYKKLKSVTRSADLAGTAEQARRTQ